MSGREEARAWLGGLACAALGLPLGRLAQMRGWAAALGPLQRCAWVGVEAALARWGGALLAEEVGAGKTHVALAALGLRGGGQVYVPAALVEQWRGALARAGLGERVALRTHGHLVAVGRSAKLGAAQAEARGGLVVVDEAHALAQELALRRRGALEVLVGRQALLLTATPAGTGWGEVGALLGLCGVEAAWRDAWGEGLRAWVERGGVEEDPARLWASVVVRHPRRLWALASLGQARGAAALRFPRKVELGVPWACDGDPALEGLEAYASSWDERLGEVPRGLLRGLLASRLESSPAALLGTVGRLEGLGRRAWEAARAGRRLGREVWRRWFRGEGAQDDAQLVFPFWFEAGGAPAGEPHEARAWEAWVERTQALAQAVARSEAGQRKLAPLLPWLAQREGRVILFARSVETARWLWAALRAAFPRRPVGLVTGSEARVGGRAGVGGAAGLGAALRALEGDEGSLLVATDVLSEGVDLARWGAVVSFDLPWTPRRLAQRLGRVDRLGWGEREVAAVVLRPCGRLEGALGLVERLTARARALGSWGGGGSTRALCAAELGAALGGEEEAEGVWRARRAALVWGVGEEGPRWGGWALGACARAAAGCLFAVQLGPATRWIWAPARGAPGWMGWSEAWARLEQLDRRPARWEASPPARAWAAAWAWATAAQEERARWLGAPQAGASRAQAEALRRLAGLGPPPRWEQARLARWVRLHEALRHRLEPRREARLREALLRSNGADGWLDAVAEAVGVEEAPRAQPDLVWLGFVRWG